MIKIDDNLIKKYPNLKYQNKDESFNSISYKKWHIENIRDGFNYFYDLNSRYPAVKDIDNFDYLPSVRQIQRLFGGMVKLRSDLNLAGPGDFSRGETRSRMAGERKRESYKHQTEFYNFLISKLPEIRVHEQKFIRPGDVTSDFFIYLTKDTGIVIDIFYAQDLRTLANVVNIKRGIYSKVVVPIYFILVGNNQVGQASIDFQLANRKIPLNLNMKVITFSEFKNNFEKYIVVKEL